MAVTTPEQHSEWTKLTDRLTADHQAHDVAIEVLDAEGGDNSLVERLPFDGIVRPQGRRRRDLRGGSPPHYPVVLRHLIDHPTEILFDLIPQGAALKITSASGTTTLVSLLRRSGHGDAQGA